MGLLSKVGTLRWFAVRPSFWNHAFALSARKLKSNRDAPHLRSAAGTWAAQQAVAKDEAYARLGLSPPDGDAWIALDAIVREGRILAESSPVTMGGPGAIDFLFGCALALRARNVVETGVAYGWSSLAFLAAFDRLGAGKLVSVDMPYPKANNEAWVGICVPERLRGRWTLIREPDRNGLVKAINGLGTFEVDIAHYDSDKSYWGRRWAYPRIWKSLRPGGLFISDDIQDNWYFREFSEAVALEAVIIEHEGKYVGCLRKPA